jgi:hypothetical protein
LKCFWCKQEWPDEQIYRCFHCKTLVCEKCGEQHFGPDHGHKHLANDARFWRYQYERRQGAVNEERGV